MSLTLADHVSLTKTGSGIVLLDQRTGRYWQLNATGAAVVQALVTGGQPTDAVAALRARYPHAADIDNHVADFVRSLRDARLVTE